MNMKNLYYYFPFIGIAVLLFFTNCDSDIKGESNPPAPVTNVEFTPNNGGGYFTYTIPADEDFLYVRGEYTIDTGKAVSKTSSVYSDTLFIEGFGEEKEYEVKLYSVDRNNNQSQPVIKRVTPLAPTTNAVLATVKVLSGFSSIVIDWVNTQKQPVTLYVNVKTGDVQATKIYASNLAKDRFSIDNLKGKPHTVTVHIRDTYENQTPDRDFGEVTPLIDGPISKKPWGFMRDQLLYGNNWNYNSSPDPFKQTPLPGFERAYKQDSLKNAPMSVVEGRIEKFWDNEYDYQPALNLNYFNTGNISYPFSYYIDMGREIQASRFKVWQRNAWGMLYGGENVESWEIWISNDQDASDGVLEDWEYVGTYKIVKPSSVIEANNLARNGHEYMFYPENPRFSRPFRYLRYKGLKAFGGGNSGCTSEITVFGTEKDGTIIEDPTVLIGAKPGWE